jgi:hypothetical protein
MDAPPAAGKLVHYLQATPGLGLAGGRENRWRPAVPPATVAVEDLADELTPHAKAAQVKPELGGDSSRRAGRGRAGGRDQLASHVRDTGHEPIPPSAGSGRRARVQRVGREFAGHQEAVLDEAGLEPDLRDRVPEHLPRRRGAPGVGWQRPRAA